MHIIPAPSALNKVPALGKNLTFPAGLMLGELLSVVGSARCLWIGCVLIIVWPAALKDLRDESTGAGLVDIAPEMYIKEIENQISFHE